MRRGRGRLCGRESERDTGRGGAHLHAPVAWVSRSPAPAFAVPGPRVRAAAAEPVTSPARVRLAFAGRAAAGPNTRRVLPPFVREASSLRGIERADPWGRVPARGRVLCSLHTDQQPGGERDTRALTQPARPLRARFPPSAQLACLCTSRWASSRRGRAGLRRRGHGAFACACCWPLPRPGGSGARRLSRRRLRVAERALGGATQGRRSPVAEGAAQD